MDNATRYEVMYKEVMKEVKNKFSPEFLNRLDDVIVFNKLDEKAVYEITKLILNKTKNRMRENGLKIEFRFSAKKMPAAFHNVAGCVSN